MQINNHGSEQDDFILDQLIYKLSNPIGSGEYVLDELFIEELNKNIGKDLLTQILNKYNLSLKELNLDDVRMIIIGIITIRTNNEWKNVEFIQKLLKKCGIENIEEKDNDDLLKELITTIKLDDDFCERVTKKKLKPGTWRKNLKFLKDKLKDYDFLIQIKSRANKAFKMDYNLFSAIANISDWQKKDKKIASVQDVQEFASEEYLLNLSSADFKDEQVITILDKRGEKILYKVKNLIDQKSIHGFVLIPINPKPEENVDIKVVFRNSKNFKEAFLDINHYLPYKEFKTHKEVVLQKLNTIIEEFKKTNPTISAEKISLNIGGQGTGGTLAAHLFQEIVVKKTMSLIDYLTKKKPNLRKKIIDFFSVTQNNSEQTNETSTNNPPHSSDKKLAKKFIAGISLEEKKFAKYVYSAPSANNASLEIEDIFLEVGENIDQPAFTHASELSNETTSLNSLLGINNLHLFTMNSGGVPKKIRNNFVLALKFLKKFIPDNKINLSYNTTIVNHDMIHKNGETDLGANVDNSLMQTTLVSINPPVPNYDNNIRNILFSGTKFIFKSTISVAIFALFAVFASLVLIFARAEDSSKGITKNKDLRKIRENIKELKKKLIQYHRFFWLGSKKSEEIIFTITRNSDAQGTEFINKKLTEKISPFMNTIIGKKVVKIGRKCLRMLQSKFNADNDNSNQRSNHPSLG